MVKFSNDYKKFPDDYHRSNLLQVLRADTRELSNSYIKYDTKTLDGNYFPLEDGPIIILILITERSRKVWTTIRPFTKEKYDYYKQLEGFMLPMTRAHKGPDLRNKPSNFIKLSEFELSKRYINRYLGHITTNIKKKTPKKLNSNLSDFNNSH